MSKVVMTLKSVPYSWVRGLFNILKLMYGQDLKIKKRDI